MLHDNEGNNYEYIKEEYDENSEEDKNNMNAVEMLPTYENQNTEENYNNNYYQNENQYNGNEEYENEEIEEEEDINHQLESKSELVEIPKNINNNKINEKQDNNNIIKVPITKNKDIISLKESKDSNISNSLSSSINN